eukprot:TRINITY_DN12115_c0_g2_i1.p1 TRINITY_DN12115_c0_g2~~TRINITY_DN12115_c0_g2_i1.p1  ORF type:complete len:199 (-),score=-6.35 TRINITY_DN12115_c0_g2_i1:452-1048(-)
MRTIRMKAFQGYKIDSVYLQGILGFRICMRLGLGPSTHDRYRNINKYCTPCILCTMYIFNMLGHAYFVPFVGGILNFSNNLLQEYVEKCYHYATKSKLYPVFIANKLYTLSCQMFFVHFGQVPSSQLVRQMYIVSYTIGIKFRNWINVLKFFNVLLARLQIASLFIVNCLYVVCDCELTDNCHFIVLTKFAFDCIFYH